MIGLVAYTIDIEKASEIKDRLEQQKGYGFELMCADALDAIPDNTAYIAVEWNSRLVLYNLILNHSANIGVAFYNDVFFSDIDDTRDIDIALEKALQDKNWAVCKGINLFYLMGDVIRKRNTLRSKPIQLQIETTDLCNAKCIMCSHAYSNGTGIDILQSGVLEKIESILPYVKVVILHGNGEPFLKKDITVYLERMRKYGISFLANTNLSVVTDQIISFFNESFSELTISCDGHTKELYESIRKGLSFESFTANVRRVRESCPNLCMKMSVVVMRQNMPYLAEIVEFAASCGFNEVIFNQLCVDEKNDNLQDAAYLYPDELHRCTGEAISQGQKSNIKVVTPYILDHTIENKTQDSSSGTECMGVCDWLVECPYIDLRGNVAPCCMKQKEYLGNIFTTGFDRIWNGEAYVRERDIFINSHMPDSCSGCDFAVQGRLKYLTLFSEDIDLLEKKTRC